MTESSRNIYMIARKAAGYTREHAAELLGVSCRCLADYEAGARTPPNDIAESMVDVYRAPQLALQHLRAINITARRILPDTEGQRLPEAVLTLISRIYAFADQHRDKQLIQIAADGVISETERAAFDQITEELDAIIQAAFAVAYHEGGNEDAFSASHTSILAEELA